METIFQGVMDVAEVAAGLTVVRAGRRLRLTRAGAPFVNSSKIGNMPAFGADFNVVATTRELYSPAGRDPAEDQRLVRKLGEAMSDGPLRHMSRVALVHIGADTDSRKVIRHELGHLFGVTPRMRAVEADPRQRHCAQRGCDMSQGIESPSFAYDREPFDLDRARRRGRAADRLRESVRPVASEAAFCGDCSEQVGRYAFFLTKLINGETVLDPMLPHFDRLMEQSGEDV